MELYKSISCGVYDLYVLWQMRKTDLVLTERITSSRVQGKILDIYTKEGAEFLTFSNGFTYRLDEVKVEQRF